MLKSKITTGCVEEVILPDFSDDDNTTTVTKSRRVSFGTNLVKEFLVGSAVSAKCMLEYEQAFPSSDSSNADSSHSAIEGGVLDQSTFAIPESQKVYKPIPPEPELVENRPKPSKFSSTICFSVDSPTADMEFTEGCITLAKSILDKKNKEMTVIIQAKPKDEEKPKEEETKYFDGSQFEMSMTRCLKSKENKRGEKKFESETTRIFSKFEDEMSITKCNNLFHYDESDSSFDDCKENRMPLDMIMRHLDKDNSDLEDDIFNPEKTFSNLLCADLSNDSEKLGLNESMDITAEIQPAVLKGTKEGKLTNVKDSQKVDSNESMEISREFLPPVPEVGSKVSQKNNSIESMEISCEFPPAVPEKEPECSKLLPNEIFEHKTLEQSNVHESMEISNAKLPLKDVFEAVDSSEQISQKINTPEPVKSSEEFPPVVNEIDPNISQKINSNEPMESSSVLPPPVPEVNLDLSLKVTSTESMKTSNECPRAALEVSSNYFQKDYSPEPVNMMKKFPPAVVEANLDRSQKINGNETMEMSSVLPPSTPKLNLNSSLNFNSINPMQISVQLPTVPEIESNASQTANLTETMKVSCELPSEDNFNGSLKIDSNKTMEVSNVPVPGVQDIDSNTSPKVVSNEIMEISSVSAPVLHEVDLKTSEEVNPNESMEVSSVSGPIEHEVDSNSSPKANSNEVMEISSVPVPIVHEANPNISKKVNLNESMEISSELPLPIPEPDPDSSQKPDSTEPMKTSDEILPVVPEVMNVVEPSLNVSLVSSEVPEHRTPDQSTLQESLEISARKHPFKKLRESIGANSSDEITEDREPLLVDIKVIENLKEQSKEPGCVWTLVDFQHPQAKTPGWLSFNSSLFDSTITICFYLKISKEKSLNSCSTVTNSEINLNEEQQCRLPEYQLVIDFGFEELKKYHEQNQRKVETIRLIPYFFDQLNSFTLKINSYLQQIYSILTLYPGSNLTGSLLSFRLYSFPIFFSSLVFINLDNLFRLTDSSLSFKKHFGTFDEDKIREIFEKCLKHENSLCEFIIQSTKYLFDIEKKSGLVSKRGHIKLLPPELKL